MKTYAIVNQKGGPGKTATTVHLAWALAQSGLRPLVIDNDSQGNATTHLGITAPEMTLQEVLVPAGRGKQVVPGSIRQAVTDAGQGWEGIQIIPSDLDLKLPVTNGTVDFFRLKDALTGVTDWDVVLIDCPPNVGVETTNALNAADEAIIVTTPAMDSVGGVAATFTTLRDVKRTTNPGIGVAGIIVNQVSSRPSADQREWLDFLVRNYDSFLLRPFVKLSDTIPRAKSAATPLASMGHASQLLAAQFSELATALMSRKVAA